MNQPQLWDSDTFRSAIARSTDPPTSRAGAEHIGKKLPDLQRRMLEAFRILHRATDNEAAAWCVSQDGGNQESLRKRRKDLERAGLVRACYARRCGVTGNPAMVYEVVK